MTLVFSDQSRLFLVQGKLIVAESVFLVWLSTYFQSAVWLTWLGVLALIPTQRRKTEESSKQLMECLAKQN